jgi:formate dehydrogenase beta subunit
VSLDQLEGDEQLFSIMETYLGTSLSSYLEENPFPVAAMLKDDEICTRCALCAERCPTDAITMEAFRFQEALSLGERNEQNI